MAEQTQEPAKPRRRIKKAKGHGGGHHGGAWKVAYADFVTAMMALFLVLWLVSQADTKLKESIANYFRSPGVFDTTNGGILSQAEKVSREPTILTSKDDEQALFSVAQNLQQKFSTRPEFSKYKDQLKIDVTDEGLRIQLIDKADRVSFPSGSAALTQEAITILTEIAQGICALPNKINIGGHTDKHVFASENGYTNWELSADRANAARRVLESVCVKPDQIHRIIGYADTEPLVPEDPYAPANRRISITVLRLNQTVEGEDKAENREVSIPINEAESSKPTKSNPDSLKKPIDEISEEKSKTSEDESKSEDLSDKNSSTQSDEKIAERRKIREKLMNEGAVKIGEPDKIPDKPKLKDN